MRYVFFTPRPDKDLLPFALLVLTGVTGLVDAVSFLGLGHVFTANMTGNVILLAFAVAGTPGLSMARSSTSLVAFLVGSALGGRLALAMAAASRRRWLLTVALSEALLLVIAAIASRRFGRVAVRRGGGRNPAFTARACTPAHRGCCRRAHRHGRLHRRPDATTGAGFLAFSSQPSRVISSGEARLGIPPPGVAEPHQSRVAATARSY